MVLILVVPKDGIRPEIGRLLVSIESQSTTGKVCGIDGYNRVGGVLKQRDQVNRQTLTGEAGRSISLVKMWTVKAMEDVRSVPGKVKAAVTLTGILNNQQERSRIDLAVEKC